MVILGLSTIILAIVLRCVYLEVENAELRDDLAKLSRSSRRLAESGDQLADRLDNLLPLGNVDPVEPSNVYRLSGRQEARRTP